MPPDEGLALFDAAVGRRGRRPAARGRQLLRQVGDLPRARPPGTATRCCSPSTTTAGRRRTSPAGSSTNPIWSIPRSAASTRCPASAEPSTTPASSPGSSPSSATRRPSAGHWTTPLAFLFIDGGHGASRPTPTTTAGCPHVRPGGTLAIHDVFPDPADGGQPPYELYLRAVAGDFDAGVGHRLAAGPAAPLTAGRRRPVRRSAQAAVGRGAAGRTLVVVDEQRGRRRGAVERLGGEDDGGRGVGRASPRPGKCTSCGYTMPVQ